MPPALVDRLFWNGFKKHRDGSVRILLPNAYSEQVLAGVRDLGKIIRRNIVVSCDFKMEFTGVCVFASRGHSTAAGCNLLSVQTIVGVLQTALVTMFAGQTDPTVSILQKLPLLIT